MSLGAISDSSGGASPMRGLRDLLVAAGQPASAASASATSPLSASVANENPAPRPPPPSDVVAKLSSDLLALFAELEADPSSGQAAGPASAADRKSALQAYGASAASIPSVSREV